MSRAHVSGELPRATLQSQGFGDRSSSRFIVGSSGWKIFHQPSIRPSTSAMILLFGHPARAGCESAYSSERSGFADHGTLFEAVLEDFVGLLPMHHAMCLAMEEALTSLAYLMPLCSRTRSTPAGTRRASWGVGSSPRPSVRVQQGRRQWRPRVARLSARAREDVRPSLARTAASPACGSAPPVLWRWTCHTSPTARPH
jgi:hypothetical protein